MMKMCELMWGRVEEGKGGGQVLGRERGEEGRRRCQPREESVLKHMALWGRETLFEAWETSARMKSPSFWEEDVKEDGLYFVLRASSWFSPQLVIWGKT